MNDVFATLTNVNFDSQRLTGMVHELAKLRSEAREELVKLGGEAAAKAVEKECSQLFAAVNAVSRNASAAEMESLAKVYCCWFLLYNFIIYNFVFLSLGK